MTCGNLTTLLLLQVVVKLVSKPQITMTLLEKLKFYVMNSSYEVFKCLYNGENIANPSGQNATVEPATTAAGYDAGTGIFTEGSGAGYIWKYMFTLPTDDVLKFLSSDFMPITLPSEAYQRLLPLVLQLQVLLMLL